MGVEDRDWYWNDRARRERLVYNPKGFRGGGNQPAPVVKSRIVSNSVIVIVLASTLTAGFKLGRIPDIEQKVLREIKSLAKRIQEQDVQVQQGIKGRSARRESKLHDQENLQ